MFSQDGHLGNPESGNFNMVALGSQAKYNGDPCTYDDVLKYDIIFNGITGFDDGYLEGGARKAPLYRHVEIGSWVPNIWFNAKTGAGRLGDGIE
jgi:hypothetical protein